MVEVGTTNRTRLDDYTKALTERTALILKVHTSNYQIIGFAETTRIGDLAQLDVPVVADLGSGFARRRLSLAGWRTTDVVTRRTGRPSDYFSWRVGRNI